MISCVMMSSSKHQLAPKLQTLMRKQAFDSVLQAAGVELERCFALFLLCWCFFPHLKYCYNKEVSKAKL